MKSTTNFYVPEGCATLVQSCYLRKRNTKVAKGLQRDVVWGIWEAQNCQRTLHETG
jgi:hypothetical protein